MRVDFLKNKNLTTYLVYFICALLLFYSGYRFFGPRQLNIQYYYNILNKNSISEEEYTFPTKVLKQDALVISNCKKIDNQELAENCYADFYKAYTIKNGPEKALSLLSQIILMDKDLTDSCHYTMHGIGEGWFIRNNKNIADSYHFDVYKYFKNVGACGNGFYHGITIGITRDVKTDDQLYETFDGFCMVQERTGGAGYDNCTHGIGHALTIYYDYNRTKALSMCDRLLKGKKGYFGCMTGVMMEYSYYLQSLKLITVDPPGLQKLCAPFATNTPQREACIMESGGFLRVGQDYIGVAKTCDALDNYIERKACMKLNIIHAIRLDRNTDLVSMCPQVSRYNERIECTAFMGAYLGVAIDLKRGTLYKQTIDDACHTLDIYGYTICKKILTSGKSIFESSEDLGSITEMF